MQLLRTQHQQKPTNQLKYLCTQKLIWAKPCTLSSIKQSKIQLLPCKDIQLFRYHYSTCFITNAVSHLYNVRWMH